MKYAEGCIFSKWCFPQANPFSRICLLSEIYFFFFIFGSVLNSIPLHSQNAVFCLIIKGGMSHILLGHTSWGEHWGWSLETCFLRFQCPALSHPSGFFVIYSFLRPFTIKKKSYLLLYFWLQNNSRWYILYREKKVTEYFTLFCELVSYFQF